MTNMHTHYLNNRKLSCGKNISTSYVSYFRLLTNTMLFRKVAWKYLKKIY
jgi:DNA-directed RNA polymerase subunit N (RpoN/RPB10)